MIQKFSLNFKNALITGASSGIGKSTAELFFKLGANILITGRNMENLNETIKLCELSKVNENQKIFAFTADLTNEEEVKKLAEKTLLEFPKLDILVNNAGIISNDNIENIVLENFDSVMNVNLRSVIQLTNLLSPSLIKTKGSIVNVSSVAGTKAFPNIMSYCISKAALEQFTKCAALDLASKGVRVNAVSPGVTITNLHKRGGMTEDAYQAFLEKSKTTHALGRAGESEEVAYSIAFLASPAASFTTGAIFPIDGGRHIMCPR